MHGDPLAVEEDVGHAADLLEAHAPREARRRAGRLRQLDAVPADLAVEVLGVGMRVEDVGQVDRRPRRAAVPTGPAIAQPGVGGVGRVLPAGGVEVDRARGCDGRGSRADAGRENQRSSSQKGGGSSHHAGDHR